MNKSASPSRLLRVDVERSGIPAKLIDKLGFEALDAEATARFLGKRGGTAISYKIPFFDSRGKEIPFARLRLLAGSWKPAFAKKKGKYKYNQREGSAPHLYFPNVIDWPRNDARKIALDYLCVTEGEKKAIKACLCGIPTVALSGVFNFKAAKKGISLIEEFSLFDFRNTVLEICFDSDLYYNEQVRVAMNQFASEAMRLAPKALRYVLLKGEERIGLDDFLASYSDDSKARRAFYKLERKEDARINAIAALDKEVAFVESQNLFYSLSTEKFYKSRHQLIDRFENLPELPDPVDPRKRIAPIKLWFSVRAESTNLRDLQYLPGKPRELHGPEGRVLNLWKPTLLARVAERPEPWLELVDYLLESVTEEEKHWFFQWLAYPIQNPGAKLYQSVFIYSHAEGVGKNFLVDPFIKAIYGENYDRQDGSVIESQFNSWVAKRQFVFIDEVYLSKRNERATAMNFMKSVITNETISINEKFQPRLTFPNYANFYISSNHADALHISDRDRRFFIVRAPENPLPPEFYEKLKAWADKKQGASKVYDYLMSYDLSGFNPNGFAPATQARAEVIEYSGDNVSYMIDVLAREPSRMLGVAGKEPQKHLYNATELLAAANAYAESIGMPKLGISPTSLGRYLANSNIVRRSRLSISINGAVTSMSLYAIFYAREWNLRDRADWLLHFKLHDARFVENPEA